MSIDLHFDNSFASVCSAEQSNECLGRLVEPVPDVFAVLEPAVPHPLQVLCDALHGPAREPVHQEPFHAQLF